MQLRWRLLGLPWHHLLLLALHRLHLLLLAGCVTAVTRNVPNLPALIAHFCSLPSRVAHATMLLLLVLVLGAAACLCCLRFFAEVERACSPAWPLKGEVAPACGVACRTLELELVGSLRGAGSWKTLRVI